MQAEIVPFHWSHVDLMDLREQERLYTEHMPDFRERVRHQHTNSLAFTYLCDGAIVACYGFIPMWPGVWEAWMLTAKQCEAHIPHLTRAAGVVIGAFMRADGVRRLQVTVKSSDLRAAHFAEFLQFEREGVLKAYGPDGSDYLMMARYPDGGTVRRRR